jgi:hypothetical protein
VLQKFNKRLLRDANENSDKVRFENIKSLNYSDFQRNRFCLLDFDLLRDDSISTLLSERKGVCELNNVSILPSKCYLVIARRSKLKKFIGKILKDHWYLSWVGFGPNLRIQTDMNEFVEIESLFETCFVIFKT